MNNDTFTIRPLEWRDLNPEHEREWFESTPNSLHHYQVFKTNQNAPWKWRFAAFKPVAVDSKEAAMAACEQHWRSELLPALLPVESAKEASV